MVKQFITLLKKSLFIIREKGFRHFFLLVKQYVMKNGFKNFILTLIKIFKTSLNKNIISVDDAIYRLLDTAPIPYILSTEKHLRINLVIDNINQPSLYDKIVASIIFAILLSNKLNSPLRIITKDKNTQSKILLLLAKLHNITLPVNYEFYFIPADTVSKKKYLLPISKNDIFVASSWMSAYLIREISIRKNYIYIIENDENIFYPASYQQVLINSILDDPNMLPVINTKRLKDYFCSKNYLAINENTLYFEPAFPYTHSLQTSFDKKKLNILLYIKEEMHLSLLTFQLINTAIERGIIKTNEWNIFIISNNKEKIKFDNQLISPNYLHSTPDNYLSKISTIDLCIALNLSPALDVIHFELANIGSVVLTNISKHKTKLDTYSQNIISSSLDLEKLLENLQLAIILAKNRSQRENNLRNNHINTNWEDSFSEVIEKIMNNIQLNEI